MSDEAENWFVEIVEKASGAVEKRMGPNDRRTADRIARGAGINLNHDDYRVRVVKDTSST